MSTLFVPLVIFASMILAVDVVLVIRDHRGARSPGLVAIFGIAAFPVAIVAHNALSAVMGAEEAVSFFIGLIVAPVATSIGTLGVALVLRRESARTALALASSGAGMALFVAYIVFAIVSTLVTGEPSAPSAIAPWVQAMSVILLVAGALVAALALSAGWRRIGFAQP